jgi:catechol 2,3-dioxygenase-like lactoylglutathione lyase family enzyme
MKQSIGQITYLVNEYDEAISYFTLKLGFNLLEDTDMGNGKRWVRVAPAGSEGFSLLLAKATTPDQVKCVGYQTGGRVAFFLYTDDFYRDYENYKSNGVEFLEEPRKEIYGTVVVFKDLYGNKWDFIKSN